MSVGRAYSVTLDGVQGHVVEVEASFNDGLPGIFIVGLPDTAVSESRQRIRAALANTGVALPAQKLTVNLRPGSLRKVGTGFDAAIALAVLAACNHVVAASVAETVHLAELGLDGRLQPVIGVLPAILAAKKAGHTRFLVAPGNLAEARIVPGVRVLSAHSLAAAANLHGAEFECGEPPEERPDLRVASHKPGRAEGDLADIKGQDEGRWALEVAAAGGHHLLMIGPPGAGKTMLAARLPGLLPDLELAAAEEVTAIHSVAGRFDPGTGLIRRPPFESPHHLSSAASVLGGGTSVPRPGSASLAHRGVLLLDEAPEFDRRVLEGLRQPLESGRLEIHRSGGNGRFPARFQLVLAANPCPCGQANGKALRCLCSPLAKRRYLMKLSGPLLDRVDLQIDLLGVGAAQLHSEAPGESSAAVAARVAAARARQAERYAGEPFAGNAEVPAGWLRKAGVFARDALADADRALDRGLLTARGYERVMRVAMTLADLGESGRPGRDDVASALQLRQRDRGPS